MFEKVKALRQEFPIFTKQNIIYFDNGATTQKPQSVIKGVCEFYENYNSNVHRSINSFAEKAEILYEDARAKVAKFVNADFEEIIFTKNTTESLNIVVKRFASDFLTKQDRVVLSICEHHSNIVPWLQLQKSIGFEIVYIPLNKDQVLDLELARNLILDKRTKIVSLQMVSNVLGNIHNFQEIINFANQVNAYVILDCAQAVLHFPIDVQRLDCDFIAFSGHKMFAPAGVGVLFGKKEHLEKMKPWLGGGDMIKQVFVDGFIPADIPYKFEAGTPNIEGVIGLGYAVDFVQENLFNNKEFFEYENFLSKYLLESLLDLDFVQVFGDKNFEQKIPTVCFNIKGVHSHDVGYLLGERNIAVRAGNHCAEPLHKFLNIDSSVRASLSFYNTTEEIDIFVSVLKEIYEKFN